MKYNLVRLIAIVSLNCLVFSSHGQSLVNKATAKEVKSILSSFNSYYQYENRNINLSKEYTAADQSGSPLSKGKFLQSLKAGKHLPVLTSSKNGKPLYKLYRLPVKTDKDIVNRLMQLGQQYYKYDQMEASKLPAFTFIDLNGNRYTNSNTNNKILVIKCWFIHCTVCVQEIPELNQLVDKYKSRKDVLFLAPALDSKKDLKAFLSKTKLKYTVIPNTEKFMTKDLQINQYPTHLIVKQGRIFKVLDNVADLTSALNNSL